MKLLSFWACLLVLVGGSAGIMFLAADDGSAGAPATESEVYLPVLRQLQVEPIIPETTVVLTEATTQYLESVSANGSTYTFGQMTPELAQLDPGDVMVTGVSETTPVGFLRLVSAISGGGPVVVTTTQATLVDAIEQGQLEVNQTLTPDMVVATTAREGVQLLQITQSEFTYLLSDVVLYQANGQTITANGEIRVRPWFNFGLQVGFFELKRLGFYTGVNETAELAITASVEGTALDEQYTLVDHELTPITVLIGPLPVVIVPILSLVVGINGEVHAEVTAAVTQQLSGNAGVGFDDGEWSNHHNFGNTFGFTPPEVNAGMEAKAYLGPDLTLTLYGVAGPYASVQANLQLEVDPLGIPWWVLYGGLEMPVGVKMEVLDHELVNFQTTVYDERWVLAAAPLPPGGTMVSVPAGNFWMGCEDNDFDDCVPQGNQAVSTYTDAYLIDVFEVTNGEYADCVATGLCTPPWRNNSATQVNYYGNPTFADYPVMYVDWHQATAYCAWAGKRLPTSAEWEKAARGSVSKSPFPWGDEHYEDADCSTANYRLFFGGAACVGDTMPVGSYPTGSSPYGALDMAGNIGEWTSTTYSDSDGSMTVRGGSWGSFAHGARVHFVYGADSDTFNFSTGFRCAVDEE